MKRCLLCSRPLQIPVSLGFLLSFKPYRRAEVCQNCQNQFQKIDRHRCCRYCGRAGQFPDRICRDCRLWQRTATADFRNRGLYRYNSAMSDYMKHYKFNGDYRLRRAFQPEFNQQARASRRLVVPIPVHPSTYRRRGFNQVRGLLGDVPMVNVLVTRNSRKHRPQSSKDRPSRLRMPQPFKMVEGGRQKIMNQNVLVVDDVYTTGTTIRHAARLLKFNGAKSVTGLTLAR